MNANQKFWREEDDKAYTRGMRFRSGHGGGGNSYHRSHAAAEKSAKRKARAACPGNPPVWYVDEIRAWTNHLAEVQSLAKQNKRMKTNKTQEIEILKAEIEKMTEEIRILRKAEKESKVIYDLLKQACATIASLRKTNAWKSAQKKQERASNPATHGWSEEWAPGTLRGKSIGLSMIAPVWKHCTS